MPELSQQTKKLIQGYQSWHQSLQAKEGVSTIHVDEVVSKVASFYEKIRGVVEWREEHLLRKTAIERILKRRLFLKRKGEAVAEPFVKELIRGGHFPNDFIEELKINEVQKVIDKYTYILENSQSPSNNEKSKTQLYSWILNIAACEIEETLSPPIKENALVNYMEELIGERIKVKKEMSEDEVDTQLYVAIQQAVFRLDPYLISYHLLVKKFPNWKSLSQIQLEEIRKNISTIWDEIEKKLNHPLAGKFYEVCEKYDTPYLILGDIIAKGPKGSSQVLESPEVLESKITQVYQERLKKLKSRMKRAAIFSVISIFVTKVLVAFAIEIPFDKYIFPEEFSYFSLGLNILIPPLLMFFLILTIRPPQKTNLQRVIIEVMKIVYQKEKKDVYEIKAVPKRGIVSNTVVVFFYALTFTATFGVIFWGLSKIDFGILSRIIFIVFISLIAFAGVKVRGTAKELVVEEKKGSILGGFVEIFAVPILHMGSWLSHQWARYNIVIVIINSLIDMPFQVFVEFLENWRSFLKEKKEKIR